MDKIFEAASDDDPALESFTPYTYPSDDELEYWDRYKVISRCRFLDINDDLAKAIMDTYVSLVLGGGLQPQVVGDDALEKDFRTWCKEHRFGVYGSFQQLTEIVLRTIMLSGDVLINTIVHNNELRIQIIEPERWN